MPDEERDDEEFASRVYQEIGRMREMISIFSKIRQKRNDLNHAGNREDALTVANVERFYNELGRLIAEVDKAAGN